VPCRRQAAKSFAAGSALGGDGTLIAFQPAAGLLHEAPRRHDRRSVMIDWATSLDPLKLAAVVYRPADDVDGLLASFAQVRLLEGRRIGGIVQRNIRGERGSRERMDVVDLMTGRTIRICQSLGKGAAACKLDPAGLAEAATAIARATAARVELVVVNKFSKQEAGGAGLRSEIADVIAAGLPLLTAVPDKCYDAWAAFTGSFGTTLVCERRILEDWWADISSGQTRSAAATCVASAAVAYPVAGVSALARHSPSLSNHHVR